MNKRILLSSVSIFASLALAAGATFAFFSDSGTSSNNVFTAGSFNLVLSDVNETAVDNVTETWTGTTMTPGGASVDATLQLRNAGTVAGNNVHVALANVVSTPADDMDKYLKITTLEYDSVNILPLITESNANGFADLEDWAALTGSHSILGSIQLGLTNTGVDHPLHMVVQLASTAPNAVQGDSVTSTFTATLHQDVSQ
jgi:spore coat-associated protein N